MHYRKNRDTTHPRLRIYCTTKEIIEEACRIMGVNPYPRRDHGKLLGWYAQVSELKAMKVLRIIAPHLTEPSKRCRARRILDVFGEDGSIPGRHPSAEIFVGCPPPTRLRKPPEAYKSRPQATHRSEVGKPGASKEAGKSSRRAHKRKAERPAERRRGKPLRAFKSSPRYLRFVHM